MHFPVYNVNTRIRAANVPIIHLHAGHLHFVPFGVAVHVLVENSKCSIGVVPGGKEALDILNTEVLSTRASK